MNFKRRRLDLGAVALILLGAWLWIYRYFSDKNISMLYGMITAKVTALDTYGKVVDQHGNPVPGVDVEARVGLYVDFTHSDGKFYHTHTDSQGYFSFVGIHDAGTGFNLENKATNII